MPPFFNRAPGREGPALPESIANSSISSLGLSDAELALLEKVRAASGEGERLTQRKLAGAAGLSLGMTNILVRRLVERGWLSLRRQSSKNIQYLLTPEGQAEIGRRYAGTLKHASKVIASYGQRLETYLLQAKGRGVESIVMVGHSEADSILEGLCERYELVFLKSADPQRAQSLARNPSVALVFAEGSPAGAEGFYL